MKSKVYFIDLQKSDRESALSKLEKLFYKAGLDKLLKPEDLTAVKVHFGEKGNLAYLRTPYVRTIINEIKACGAKPFLTDANVLYKSSRNNAVEHLETAYLNGFSYSSVAAPIIIADGLEGKDYTKIQVGLQHFKEVNIASCAVQADALISLAHFKLHEVTGFGGTLKNIGMGLGSRSGKQLIHAEVRPKVNPARCSGDAKCVKWCPSNAISMIDHKAVIDTTKCVGCAECIPTCRTEAIEIDWSGSSESVQEKIVEYFYGAVKDKLGKLGYINFILDISPECDCYGFTNLPVAPNIGILAAVDPVAIDQASVDLLNQQTGIPQSRLGNNFEAKDKIKAVYPYLDWEVQLKYAEKIGLGSRKYELVKI